MAILKDKINEFIKEKKSIKNAKDESIKWYKETYKEIRNREVISLNIGTRFKAGKIYKFSYSPTSETLPYYDSTPIIISLGRIKYKNSFAERGINLNYLPHEIRIHVIDLIYNSYRNSIEAEMKGKKSNNAELQSGLPISYNSMKVMLSSVYAQYAIRNYTVTNMTEIGNVSYEQWHKAALIQTDNFVGSTQGTVYEDYRKYINQVISKR